MKADRFSSTFISSAGNRACDYQEAQYRTVMSLAFINDIITNPAYHDYLAILKGARSGFVYGTKVRFPHAVVMSILFGRGEYVPFHKHCLPAINF